MNTEIIYLYRDAGNYKNWLSIVVEGEITADQKKDIHGALSEGMYFIPRQVGLPEERFDTLNDLDHSWFEMDCDNMYPTDRSPSLIEGKTITAGDVVDRFRSVKAWDESLWVRSLTEEEHKRVFR